MLLLLADVNSLVVLNILETKRVVPIGRLEQGSGDKRRTKVDEKVMVRGETNG